MKITITNPEELLDFVERDNVTSKKAVTIINTYLDVFYPSDISKATLIRSVEYLLENYGTGVELPFFPDIILI